MRASRRRDGRGPAADAAGLTLLEVLFALAILGIGLAVIMQGIAMGVRVRRESAEMQGIGIVAAGRLDAILARGEAPEEGEEGEVAGVTWRIETDPSLAGDEEQGDGDSSVPVRLVVEGPSGRSLEVVTLVPPAEGGE